MEVKKDILFRVYLSFIGMAVLGMFVLGRAFYIQRVEGKFWLGMSDSLHLRNKPIEPNRGTIYSEDGNILSTSVPIFDVYIDFGADGLRAKSGQRFKENIDSLSLSLANLFNDKPAQEYKRQLQLGYKNKQRYFALKKKINFTEYQTLRNFPLVRLGRNKSGFIFEDKDKRINPYILLANRTIGISRPNAKQNVGLELTYDSLLAGIPGQKLMRYAAGAYMPVEGSEVDPINGKDIVTTLDTYMQDIVQGALMEMLVQNNSLHGSVILMETATGKIKAIANLGRQEDGTYAEDLNYGIGKATEPGSVFKLASLLSLLEDGYVNNETIVDCQGGVANFYGINIRDSHRGTGKINMLRAFYTSSNVAFALLVNKHYKDNPKQFTDHLHKFRLDQMTGIDIIATSGKPFIKTKEKNRSWSRTTLPFMAHGYEETLTPLHLLMLYNAVANDGKMMKPYLVNAVQDYGVNVKTIKPVVLVDKIASDATLKQARLCLNAVVDSVGGTGHRVLWDSTYKIAGKTGTAVSAIGNQGYNKNNKIYQASFMGYFPSDAPKYSMAVVIQNSRESKLYYGADVSGRVFKNISDKIYGHFVNNNSFLSRSFTDSSSYNLAGTQSDLSIITSFLNLKNNNLNQSAFWNTMRLVNKTATAMAIQNADAEKKLIPNVVGLGLKDALYMLESKGLKVGFAGRGKVIGQNVGAGASFRRGDRIELLLN